MKRTPIILALAIFALAACGDNDDVTPDDGDSDETTASLTVTRLGVPVADYIVLIHDESGALVGEARTAENGSLEFDVDGIAAVTVATELGNLVTIGGIRPGDEVLWTPEPEATRKLVGTVDITAPGASSLEADRFRYMACGRTETGVDPKETVSIGIDNSCLRGSGDLSIFAVATENDEHGATNLVAFTGQKRIVPKIGEETVINFGVNWDTNWQVYDFDVARPGWANDGAAASTRSSVVFDGYDYELPAVPASAKTAVKFPAGYADQRVAAITWTQETEFGAIARSSQWVNPETNTVGLTWPTPPTQLNTTFDGDYPVLSWDGKLGNAVAAEISWQTASGFRSWTYVDRGDVSNISFPELTGLGSFVAPRDELATARAYGLSRGTTGYAESLGAGIVADMVWAKSLRRSIAIGTGAQLTEIQSTNP